MPARLPDPRVPAHEASRLGIDTGSEGSQELLRVAEQEVVTWREQWRLVLAGGGRRRDVEDRFSGLGCVGGEVDQALDLGQIASLCNDRAAIGMAHKHHRLLGPARQVDFKPKTAGVDVISVAELVTPAL